MIPSCWTHALAARPVDPTCHRLLFWRGPSELELLSACHGRLCSNLRTRHDPSSATRPSSGSLRLRGRTVARCHCAVRLPSGLQQSVICNAANTNTHSRRTSWGKKASSLAPSTNNSRQLPPAGPGTLPFPGRRTCPARLLVRLPLAGCERRLTTLGWCREVTDSRQPQDQSVHWTRPVRAARRMASATGPSAHHRGNPHHLSIPCPRGAVEPVPTGETRNLLGEAWELPGRPTTPCPRLHHALFS